MKKDDVGDVIKELATEGKVVGTASESMVGTSLERTRTKVNKGAVTTTSTRKYVCSICGAEFDSLQRYAAHMKKHKHEKKGEGEASPSPQELGYENATTTSDEEQIIKSPKEKLEEWFISELEKRLPRIVGKRATEMIIETIREDPDMIWDSRYLKYHIVQLAPRNINDYLLDFTLKGLYDKLQESKAKIESAFGHMLPVINPPEPAFRWGPRVTPPREYRHWYEEPEYYNRQYPPQNEPRGRTPETRYQPEEPIIISLLKAQLEFQSKLMEKLFEKEEKEERKIPIRNPFGEGVIEIPESQVLPYMMMIMSMTSRGEKEEATITIPTEEGPKKMTAQEAITYLLFKQGEEKAKAEEEKRKALEEELKAVRQQVIEMSRALTPENLVKAMEQLGYHKHPSPTYDLINKTRQDINAALDRIFTLLETQIKRQMAQNPPNIPETGKYTPEERQEKIEDIKQRINKAEKLAKLEKEIVEAVEAK